MARFYSNENFPIPVVEHLKGFGHDCITVFDRGLGGEGVTDWEVLTYAIAEQRAVLTINRIDFFRLHQTYPNHYGIIACTLDSQFRRQVERIHEAVKVAGNLNGKLIRVNRPQV